MKEEVLVARVDNLSNFLTDVADAIRSKKGTQEEIPAYEFDTEIESIVSEANIEQSKSATPSTSSQIIVPSQGYDGMAEVTISAVTASIDANITANNVAQGITILGVTGTYDGGVAAALGGAY